MIKKEKAAMVLKELKIRKVAMHNFLKGLFINAYLKLEKISPTLLDKYLTLKGVRFLSFKVDLLLTKMAGIMAKMVQMTPIKIDTCLAPFSALSNQTKN